MKLGIISDTHNRHDKIELEEVDILLHAGDQSELGTMAELAAFNKWMGELDIKHKIVIAGNHDFYFQKKPLMAAMISDNYTYIEDELIEVEGLKIYGSPWQPEFGSWAFNLPRGEKIKEKWDMIPEGIDILITHGPPHGILDKCPLSEGCEELYKAVKRIKPKYHIFGHIHEGYGTFREDETTFINASFMNGLYVPTNKPIIIEI
jgi:Icc-related predicted phosphoesterase